MHKPNSNECPTDESFVRYISGGLGEHEKNRLVEHATRCPYCRLRLSALSSIQTELEARKNDLPEAALSPQDEIAFRKMARAQMRADPKMRRTVFLRRVRAGGLLAAGLILLVAGYRLFMRVGSPEAVVRGSARVEIKLHRPEGKIREAPKVFSWSKVKESDGYRLNIIDDDINLVFSAGLTGTRLLLPEEVRQKLEHQKAYLWTVSAYGDDDQELASASSYFEIE